MRRRVVITGMGVVSAIGTTVATYAKALRDGQSGIRPLDDGWPAALRGRAAAAVSGFDEAAHFTRREASTLDRFAQFGAVAARDAIGQAGETAVRAAGDRACVVTGACVGGQNSIEDGFERLLVAGEKALSPFTVPRTMANAGASHISMAFGLRGPAYTVSSACASANHAIGQAFWMVRHGIADLAVTGGSEAPLSFAHLKAWDALRVLSPDTCRPFCGTRNGLVLGEGAGMLVLEPLEAALMRGAAIHGEICGFGMSADANHLTQPTGEGGVRAMRAALMDAGLTADDVDYVNAHGTGTRAGDASEAAAIHEVFGARATQLPVTATKAMHGHALGATGALEAIATVLALRDGFLPPTVNFREPDETCRLDVVPNLSRAVTLRAAISNAFAFGGLNAMLVFRRAEEGWT